MFGSDAIYIEFSRPWTMEEFKKGIADSSMHKSWTIITLAEDAPLWRTNGYYQREEAYSKIQKRCLANTLGWIFNH